MNTNNNDFLFDFISIRVGADNLMYLFFSEQEAFSFDAFSPKAILHGANCDFQKQNYTESEIFKLKPTKNRKLVYSFTTHGHYDHNGGDKELLQLTKSVTLINFSNFKAFQKLQVSHFTIIPIETSCHTLDSLCFYITNTVEKRTYITTGDFLFKLGCGKFFEGNSKLFIKSLEHLVANIRSDTLLLYGHDYFATNRKFTEKFYPVSGCDEFFLTLSQEEQFNPFFRVMDIENLEGSREERIAKLRQMKDEFKLD